jgi:hypothetical protein
MLKDQKDLLAAFNTHGVNYLVIGAHAVGVHAEPRGTKDLDVFIKADPENSKAVFAALAEYGWPRVQPDCRSMLLLCGPAAQACIRNFPERRVST